MYVEAKINHIILNANSVYKLIESKVWEVYKSMILSKKSSLIQGNCLEINFKNDQNYEVLKNSWKVLAISNFFISL